MKRMYEKQKRYAFLKPIKRLFFAVVIFTWHFTTLYAQTTRVPLRDTDVNRVNEIMEFLPERPSGYGDPCSKRDVWDKLMQSGKYDKFLEEMENFTFPQFSKEDYFSLHDGTATSSGRGLGMMRNRARGLAQVVWAECLENKGRYTKIAEEGLRDIINQKSWVSPRIDYDFKNYNGIEYSVELTSSLYAHTIAQTLYMMGDKISPGLKQDAIDALYKRVFNPVLNKIKTQNTERENNFLTSTNNWNHVCLAGLVGAALTIIQDKYERAVFTWIGEYYSQNGLVGFGEDGYCTEGLGYYNYGIGHFIMLRESILQATAGKVDLFSYPKVRNIAAYPVNIEIMNGVFPSISDNSDTRVKPQSQIMYYFSRNLGMALSEYDSLTFEGYTDDNRMRVMLVFPNSASKSEHKLKVRSGNSKIRSFFEHSVVLVTRPLPNSSCSMGVSMKGGDNGESHNHNDVGSYNIVLGSEIMAGDPGGIPYTADIFTAEYRYTYKTISSYGHPVPLVAGREQQTGAHAEAKVVLTKFTKNKDELIMDIASAYDIPQLEKLERKFIYTRKGQGSLTISDNVIFNQPEVFETAIITRSRWTQLSDNTLLLEGTEGKLHVTFTSPGNRLLIRSEEIGEGGTPYTRIGIYIDEPVNSGQFNITYKP